MTHTVTFRTYDHGRTMHGPGVTISKAPNADVCESPICPVDHGLIRVDLVDYGSEVLCPSHADDLLEAERGW